MSNLKPFKNPIIVIILFLVVLAALLFLISVNKNRLTSKNTSSPVKEVRTSPLPANELHIFNINNEYKSSVGNRLFLELAAKSSVNPNSFPAVVYIKNLDTNKSIEKFAQWPSFQPHSHDLRVNNQNELFLLGALFDKNLEKKNKTSSIITELEDKQSPEKSEELANFFRVISIQDPIYSFAPDEKSFAFITYVTDAYTEEYANYNLQKNIFYIQNADTGTRKAYKLPGGAANWSINGWSQDGERIYLTKFYYEAHRPHEDSILVFNVKSGSTKEIKTERKLEFPLIYDPTHEIFYGIEYNTDSDGELIPPSKLWRINGKTEAKSLIYSSPQRTLNVRASNNGNILLSEEKQVEYKPTLDKLYVVNVESNKPEPVILKNTPRNPSDWLLSGDGNTIIWRDGSLINRYDMSTKKESLITDINELEPTFKDKGEFNGMVLF